MKHKRGILVLTPKATSPCFFKILFMDIFYDKENNTTAIRLVTLDSGVIGSEASLLNEVIRELLLLLLKNTMKTNKFQSDSK